MFLVLLFCLSHHFGHFLHVHSSHARNSTHAGHSTLLAWSTSSPLFLHAHHIFHHLLHLIVLLEHFFNFGVGTSAASGNSFYPGSSDDSGINFLLIGTRINHYPPFLQV